MGTSGGMCFGFCCWTWQRCWFGPCEWNAFFFSSRFRALGVRDGEMSPLSFQANQMIILKGNFLSFFSISLNTLFYLRYIFCSIVKGDFSIWRIYSVFDDSPQCNREECSVTLFITVFNLRTKQRTHLGLKLTPNAHSLPLGLLNILTKSVN